MTGRVEDQRVVVIGAGGLGREVLWTVRTTDGFEPVGFLDDNTASHGREVGGAMVLGDLGWCDTSPLIVKGVVAVGDTRARYRLARRMAERGLTGAVVVAPTAVVAPSAHLSVGAVVMAGAVITTDVHVGAHVCINPLVNVGHDACIGSYCLLAPGCRVSGFVRLGDGTFVGAGAVILPGIEVGQGATIGAGAVVTKNLPPGVTAMGVPATWTTRREPWPGSP